MPQAEMATTDKLNEVLTGCAGWSISSAAADAFPAGASHLARYAKVLPAVEINTSFYRPHRPATYARWRDSVPEDFRFCVKMPKEMSHLRGLRDCGALLEKFMAEAGELRHKLGCLLLQLPPKLAYDAAAAQDFLGRLRDMTEVAVMCEPRHASWFAPAPAALLAAHDVGYVEPDPRLHAPPRQECATVYLRLHGSPRIYYSDYPEEYLDALAERIAVLRRDHTVWCVFDNTAEGAALPNALTLRSRLASLRKL